MAPATVSGFIIPDGDSFPTTTHSAVVPPNNVASDLSSTPSAASTTTSHIVAASTSTASPISEESSSVPNRPVALIVGIILGVLGVLVILGVIFFFVRRHFIHKRASKVTPARARASQVVISGPVDFQHVSSADGNAPLWSTSDKISMNFGSAQWNPQVQPDLENEEKGAAGEGPYQQNYTPNFGKLESGLNYHVQAMQSTRNPRQDSF